MAQNQLILDRQNQLTRKDLFERLRNSVLESLIAQEDESLGLMFYCNEVVEFCDSKISTINHSLGLDFTPEEKTAVKALASQVLKVKTDAKVEALKAKKEEQEKRQAEAERLRQEEIAQAEQRLAELRATPKPVPKVVQPKEEPRLDRTIVKVKKLKKKVKKVSPQVVDVSSPAELQKISQKLSQEQAIDALSVPDAVKASLKRQLAEGKSPLWSGQTRPTGSDAPRPFPSAARMTEQAVIEASKRQLKAQEEGQPVDFPLG